MDTSNNHTNALPAAAVDLLLTRYQQELRDPTDDHLKKEFGNSEMRNHSAMARALGEFPIQPLDTVPGHTWIWSDLHFGHGRVIECSSRPFGDVETMNEALFSVWEKTVGPDDQLIVLGDICMAPALNEETFDRIRSLPGHKILVPGNHDFRSSSGKLRVEGFDQVCALLYRRADDLSPALAMTHVPVPDLPEGWINLHGHWHDRNNESPRHINVSVEQLNFAPVDFRRICALARALDAGATPSGTTLERIHRAVPPPQVVAAATCDIGVSP